MRKLLIGLVIVAGLLVLAAVIVPPLVPVEAYKSQIVERVEDATGREMRIDGDLKLSVFPSLALEAEDVSLANMPGGRAASMIELERVVLGLSVAPLLRGDLAFDRLELVRPVVHLERTERGRTNWEFDTEERPARVDPAERSMLERVSIDQLRIVDGRVTYTDVESGTTQDFRDLDLSIDSVAFGNALEVDGELVWNGEEVEVELRVDDPQAWAAGEYTPVVLNVSSPAASLRYRGAMAGAQQARGEVEFSAPSVNRLAAFLGAERRRGTDPGPLRGRARVLMNGDTTQLQSMWLQVGDTTATGQLRVRQRPGSPRLTGSLDVDRLDLDAYLGDGADGGSSEPLDLSSLHAVDAELDLRLGSLRARGVELGRTVVDVDLQRGRLALGLNEVALYGGEVRGQVLVETRRERGLDVSVPDLSISDVQVRPLLMGLNGYDGLSGRMSGQLSNVQARGTSPRELLRSLDGRGRFEVRDGTIEGAEAMQALGSLLVTGRPAGTQFARMTARFDVRDGVVHNEDLELEWPPLEVKGRGTVSLAEGTLDYTLVPNAVLSLGGAGGLSAGELVVPVHLQGPWSNLSWTPVWTEAQMVGPDGQLRTPTSEALRQLPPELRERLPEGVLEDLMRGRMPGVGRPEGPAPSEQPPTEEPEPADDPVEAVEETLRDIFGGASR